MGSPPIFLEPRTGPRGSTIKRTREAPYRLRRWARGLESQPPDSVKQACLVGKGQVRREAGKLAREGFRRHCISEQYAHTAAVAGAFDVNGSIADEPYIGPGRDPARGERQLHRLACRFVGRRVARTDDAAEILGPAEPRDFSPQQFAGLVADHPEKDALPHQVAQHRLAAGQRGQAVEVDGPEAFEVDVSRLFPAVTEM